MPLLDVRLSVDYPGKPGVLRDVTFQLNRGEILGLVGKSGSGKSTLALAILGLLDTKGARARGHVLFQGRDLLALPEKEMRRLRGREIGLVLQSPLASLNPGLLLSTQLEEAWRAHANGGSAGWAQRASELMESVSLSSDPAFLRRRPAELSVGLAQRVLIALAILHRPPLLLADEPTSALDVITQAEILELFARLNRNLGMGMLYISHDLLSVASLCNRIAILHEGAIVETGPPEQIFSRPEHPYTRRLVDALPRSPR
jgi:ABC-type glutathione transport system ATPase component